MKLFSMFFKIYIGMGGGGGGGAYMTIVHTIHCSFQIYLAVVS